MSAAGRRIAVGRLWQETNTFSDARTSLADFRRNTFLTGDAMLESMHSQDDELAGFTDVLDNVAGVTYVPLVSATTWCGGPVLPEVVDAVTTAAVEGLANAATVDAVLFSMHGALAGVEVPDVTAHVLRAIRRQIGPRIPLVITLDHHANVTRAMIESVDATVAYRHCPHVDMRDTGRRGAQLLMRILDGAKPTIAYRKIPLITPAEGFRTAQMPMKGWFDLAGQMTGERGVLDAQCYPVQPWLDVPELGWSAVVVTDGNRAVAEKLCVELADYAWSHRREFYFTKHDSADAVRTAAAYPRGPVVIADGADATNGGSPGDSTCLLGEMLRQKITCRALLTMVDADAVAMAYAAGSGATITLDLGAKFSRKFHQPLRVTARIGRFSDGNFRIAGHLAAKVSMGRCAVLEIGSVRVVVSECAGPGHDPQVFRQIGLEPLDAQIVVVKATVGHMEAYREIMKLNLPTECPGPSPSYLDRLDYRRIPRPMFPLDQEMTWAAEGAA